MKTETTVAVPAISRSIQIGFFATFTNAICTAISFFISLYLVTVSHFNILNASIIVSSFGLGAIVGSYSSHKLTRYFSNSLICTYALIFNAISLALFPHHKYFAVYFIVTFFIGLTNYAFIPANQMWLKQQVNPRESLFILQLRRFINNFGIGLAVFVGTWVANVHFAWVFYIGAGLLLMAGILQSTQSGVHAPVLEEKKQQSGVNVWRDVNFMLLMGSLLLIGIAFSQLRTTYAIFLFEELHLPHTTFGMIFFLNMLVVMTCQVPLGKWLHRFPKNFMMGAGAFLIGLGLYLTSSSHNIPQALIAALIWTLGEIIFFSRAYAIVKNWAPKSQRKPYMNAYQLIYASALVIGPVTGGWLYFNWGPEWVWSICGILAIVSTVFIWFGLKTPKASR